MRRSGLTALPVFFGGFFIRCRLVFYGNATQEGVTASPHPSLSKLFLGIPNSSENKKICVEG